VALATSHWPSSEVEGPVSELMLLGCSSIWQRISVEALASLSDGSLASGSSLDPHVAFSSSNSEVAALVPETCDGVACSVLVASAAGSTSLSALFGGLSSPPFLVTVLLTETPVSTVSLSAERFSSSDFGFTLNGVVGSSVDLVSTLTFGDGTSLRVAFSGVTTSAWLPPSSLLAYVSSDLDALTVDDNGSTSLVGNLQSSIVLTATDSCGGSASASVSVYSNLAPLLYDIDLGAVDGPSLGLGLTMGATLDVDVRVQASSTADLTAFQIVLQFDSSLLQGLSPTEAL
jgi:hypothetical protein